MELFPKKVIQKFGPRNLFSVLLQTRCQVSAIGGLAMTVMHEVDGHARSLSGGFV